MTLEDRFSTWYSWLPSFKADSVDELGANDSCLVSVEGWILRSAAGSEYDGHFLSSPQYLTMIYQFEKFMSALQEVSVLNVTLIFFDCLQGLLSRFHPSLWALRNALYLHCRLFGEFKLRKFPSWYSQEYSDFISERFSFVFYLEDGSGLVDPASVLADDEIVAEKSFYPLYSLLLDTVSRGMNAALFYRMQRSGRRLNTFSVFPRSAVPDLGIAQAEFCRQAMNDECATYLAAGAPEILTSMDSWFEGIGDMKLPNFRSAILASCCREICGIEEETDDWPRFFIKAVLLLDLALRVTTIEQRKIHIGKPFEFFEYQGSIEILNLYISGRLQDIGTSATDINAANEIADLFDERVLRAIILAIVEVGKPVYADFFGLNELSIQHLESIWKLIVDDSESDFFPIQLVQNSKVVSYIRKSLSKIEKRKVDREKSYMLPVENNDFLSRMSGTDQHGLIEGLINGGGSNSGECFGDLLTAVKTQEFDVAENHINRVSNRFSESYPKWIERKSGEEKLKAIKRWKLKREQDARLFARNINKYFGGLDKLHHPIVLIGGRASGDHPWTITVAAESESSKQLSKGKVKKTTATGKAAKIIAANVIKMNEKLKVKEQAVSGHLTEQLDFLFKKMTARPGLFADTLIELLLGGRTASDTSVLEDFGMINKSLSLADNQAAFLTSLGQKLLNPLEHSWKRRQIIESNQVAEMLRLIGVVFRFVQVTIDKHVTVLTSQQIRVYQNLLLTMGFMRSAAGTFKYWAETQLDLEEMSQRKKVDPESRRKKMKKLESEALVTKDFRPFDFAIRPQIEGLFQVKYLGADMERTLGSTTDARVSFKPDAWQKRLLDVVDEQHSCLVVAPTASGKTFAAYYAMDKVLRFDNESCVLFISPTRALALQVEAEVIARFSGKTYPTSSKTSLVGHLFEDREEKWNQCQILITVPSCLEQVLCSTSSVMNEWTRKVRYAILDEIHCIGEEKTGRQWENLIQLLPCPFMALSATVGNEFDFREWLENAQSVQPNRPVHFIKHDERYADLQTLYYDSGSRSLYNLNPIMCLDFDRVKIGGDIDLVPTDTLDLYMQIKETILTKKSFTAIEQENYAKQFVRDYDPEFYFIGCRAITKKQYRRYLRSILIHLQDFTIRGVIDKTDFDDMLRRFWSRGPIGIENIEPWWTPGLKDPPVKVTTQSASTTTSLKQVLANTNSHFGDKTLQDPNEFLALIRDMEARKLMPALVFNFNRSLASRLFYKVANKLVNEHHDKYYGSPESTAKTKAVNKRRQDEYRAILARREMAEKWKTLSKQQREEQGIDEREFVDLTGPAPPPPSDIAEEHDPEFFLCDKKIYLSSKEEFDGVLVMCKLEYHYRLGRIPPVLLEALKRGIGLYHDALHREYRRAVELLFRMRYLRIVVSDSSLSLGINMPCKSTVFAGDSTLLTALLYRQTSGRAGRRGFDSLGHVIFWEFPFKKIQRLLTSKLPMLSGNFPVKPTAILRAMVLAKTLEQDSMREMIKKPSKATTSPEVSRIIDLARAKVSKMFTTPLYYVGASNKTRSQLPQTIKISFRYAVDLLRRLKLLNKMGHAQNLAEAAFAIMDDDPFNIFFIILILSHQVNNKIQEPVIPDSDASELPTLDP